MSWYDVTLPWEQEKLGAMLITALRKKKNEPGVDIRHTTYIWYDYPCLDPQIGRYIDTYTATELFELLKSSNPQALYKELGLRAPQKDLDMLRATLNQHLQECEHCLAVILDELIRTGITITNKKSELEIIPVRQQVESSEAPISDWTKRYYDN